MERIDGREDRQIRPLKITPSICKHATGSALIELGDTQVRCTVTIDGGVPHFLKYASPPQGWLTAEYSMLPTATANRLRRERTFITGRTQEIQRLIGRSLRGIIDLCKCPDITMIVDCDVIQADGGTRSAAITGAYVALKLAMQKRIAKGKLTEDPISSNVAAISVGIKDDRLLCDLNFQEDSSIDLDMNVVTIPDGGILEVQGTAENSTFSQQQLSQVVALASECIKRDVFVVQDQAIQLGLSALTPPSSSTD